MSERATPLEQMAAVPPERPTMAGRRRGLWLIVILPFLIVLGLYWPTLTQPYFWDDVVHFLYVMPRSLRRLLTNAEGLGAYYRPIPFTLYKLLITLQKPGTTLPSHLVLLAVHSMNATLTGCLTRRLLVPRSPDLKTARPILGMATYDLAGLLAALFFACYPYAALPVAHLAAIMHPIVTLLVLGAVLATLHYLPAGRPRWFALAMALAALAPYAHESGIMAGAIALLVAVLDDWSSVWRSRRALWALPVASALFLPVWLVVPKMHSSFEWLGMGNLLASLTFFSQGPTFPFQPASRLLINWLPSLNPSPLVSFVGLPWWLVAAMWVVALSATVVAGVTLMREGRWRILGVAFGWTWLAALPSIVALPFPYITVSQRLLYSSAPGAAMLWAVVALSLASRLRRPALQRIAVLAVAAGIVAVPVLYVRREVALHEFAFRPLEQLVDVAQSHPAEKHLVVNAVNWVNYWQPWYALGQEGISVSAPYVELDSLVWLNAQTPARFSAASFPEIGSDLELHSYSTINETQPWTLSDTAVLFPQYDRVWITQYSDGAITVEEAGSVRQGTDLAPTDYVARWGDGVFLVDVSAQVRESLITLELQWKILDGVAGATVFRHVYGCDGQMLAQGDGLALGGTLQFALLQPGSYVRDIRHIPLEQASEQSCLALGLGLYLPDGSRVPAWRMDGSPLEDDVYLLPTNMGFHP